MGRSVALVLCLVCVALAVGATDKKKVATPEELEAQSKTKLDALFDKRKGGIVSFDTSSYNKFVHNTPRNYTVILLFVAMDPRHKCEACRSVLPEFRTLAASYMAQSGLPPVVFATIDFDHAMDTFKTLEINYTPILAHIGPNMGKAKKKAFTQDDKFDFSMGAPDAEAIAGFINRRSGVDIPIVHEKPWLALLSSGAMILVSFLLMRKRLMAIGYWRVLSVVAIGAYFFLIAGIMFTVIRRTPPFMRDKNGAMIMVYPSTGTQFILEAGVVGGFIALGAGVIWWLIGLPKMQIVKADQYAKQCAYVLGGSLMLMVAFGFLNTLFLAKQGGYPFQILAPRSFMNWRYFDKSGPIRSV